jgi:hypothetical protein
MAWVLEGVSAWVAVVLRKSRRIGFRASAVSVLLAAANSQYNEGWYLLGCYLTDQIERHDETTVVFLALNCSPARIS